MAGRLSIRFVKQLHLLHDFSLSRSFLARVHGLEIDTTAFGTSIEQSSYPQTSPETSLRRQVIDITRNRIKRTSIPADTDIMTTIIARLYVVLLTASALAANAWVQSPPSSLQSNYRHRRLTSSLTRRHASLDLLSDPSTLQAVQSTLEQHAPNAATAAAAAASHGVIDHHHNVWTTILANSLSFRAGDLTISPNTLQPAHEHAASWFGAADPYLEAGKSIAPTAKGLTSLDVLPKGASSGPLPEALQNVLNKGWNLLDARTIQQETFLPGFSPTQGILPAHQAPPETPESFATQVEWSARFLKVVDKLPQAALAYAMIEFFLLRPNIDLYKEEIRQEPGAVAMETLVTTAVRLAAFSVVAVVTLGIFG